MASKLRSVAVGIAYALFGAVVFGGAGIIVGIAVAPDAGLEGVFNAVVGGAAGAVVGGIVGLVVFVAGSKALERQVDPTESGGAQGPKR